MKKKIALVAGGFSGESVVSLASAQNILENIDQTQYEVYLIKIEPDQWYHDDGKGKQNPVDKNDFSIQVNGQKITFDMAMIAIHGNPGEDGKLQGYFDLLNIPYNTCSALVSAVTFNKSFCNNFLRSFNVTHISQSIVVDNAEEQNCDRIKQKLSFPLFVKPNESGSSIGISRVNTAEELPNALKKGFETGSTLLVEEFIKGTELTVGVYQNGNEVHALPITEVISKREFFDFEAKYDHNLNQEITPARVSAEVKEMVQTTAQNIYQTLHCSGLVRIDFILQEKTNKLYFLEVNTVPGQSKESLVPKAIVTAGMTLKQFYSIQIETTLNKR